MGKQSARLYFEGKDHFDAVYYGGDSGTQNHSKIYLGAQLLWEREIPKFLFGAGTLRNTKYGDGSIIATSNGLSAFSEFHNQTGITYFVFLKGNYWGIKYRSKEMFCSKDGYEWRRVGVPEDIFSDNVADDMFVYMGLIYSGKNDGSSIAVLITLYNIIYFDAGDNGKLVFDAKYNLGTIERNVSFINSGRCILAGFRQSSSVIRTGVSITAGEAPKKVSYDDFSDIYAGAESNCFFRADTDGIFRSNDGAAWSLICPGGFKESGIAESGGFVYIFVAAKMGNIIEIDRINKDYKVEKHIISQGTFHPEIFVIGKWFLVSIYRNGIQTIYKTKDIFSFYIDENGEISGSEDIEAVKTTFHYLSLLEGYGAHSGEEPLIFYSTARR